MNDADLIEHWVKLAQVLTKRSNAIIPNVAVDAAAVAAADSAIKSVRLKPPTIKPLKQPKPLQAAGGNQRPGKNAVQASGAGVAAPAQIKPIKPLIG